MSFTWNEHRQFTIINSLAVSIEDRNGMCKETRKRTFVQFLCIESWTTDASKANDRYMYVAPAYIYWSSTDVHHGKKSENDWLIQNGSFTYSIKYYVWMSLIHSLEVISLMALFGFIFHWNRSWIQNTHLKATKHSVINCFAYIICVQSQKDRAREKEREKKKSQKWYIWISVCMWCLGIVSA